MARAVLILAIPSMPSIGMLTIAFFLSSLSVAPTTQADDSPESKAPPRSSQNSSDDVPGFQEHVVPLLTQLGCNAGACHGAAAGRGGMALSLFGSRPASDYEEIVVDLRGRRVHRIAPEKSLLLAKPSGLLDHEGGVLIERGDEAWRAIEAWMLAGCPDSQPPPVRDLELRLQGEPSQTFYRVIATNETGEETDVTLLASIQADQPDAVRIDRDQHAIAFLQPGIHSLFARYRDRIAVQQRVLPIQQHTADVASEKESQSRFEANEIEHEIDRRINRRLEQLHLPRVEMADEPALLRRLYFDLLGRGPTIRECETYSQSLEPQKRIALVDSLLARQEFEQFSLFRWSKRLGIRSLPNDSDAFQTHLRWLEQRIREDAPVPEIAAELVLAEGDSRTVGPAHFIRSQPDPKLRSDAFGRIFLGIQLSCAQCHDHPLDRWTQDDFHGFATIFAKTLPGTILRFDRTGTITHLGTKQPAAPSLPGQRDPIAEEDPRIALATWLRSENRLLAKAQVNWIWSEFMGRGLVEPIDAITPTRPGDHPELLEHLTDFFIQNQYRVRPLIRYLLTSQTYARRARTLEESHLTERFLARAAPRPLDAEVYGNAIDQLREHYAAPKLENALVADPFARWVDGNVRSDSLEILGRCRRPEACGDASRADPTLRRELHLMNSSFLDRTIEAIAEGWQKRFEDRVSVQEIVDEFHRLAFQRPITDSMAEFCSSELVHPDPVEQRRRWEDYLWSVLVSQAFRTH